MKASKKMPARCRPGSIEQHLDMCEEGDLRGDDQLQRFHADARIMDVPVSNRDEHSSGYQGTDLEFDDEPIGMEDDESIPVDEQIIEHRMGLASRFDEDETLE